MTLVRLAPLLAFFATLATGAGTDGLKLGKAPLKSAGVLAFGPDGVLFVGDSVGAAIFALDTQDRASAVTKPFEVTGISEKIAAVLGSAPDQILIYDTAVNPISKNVYLSVSRGRGPDAAAVILKLDRAGKLSVLSLDSIRFASASLPNAARGPRMEAITSIQYIGGNVIVAGLSNEEFSSNLRSIPFPFPAEGADAGAGIEIYHTSHGAYETNAPVRTFIPLEIGTEEYILAAYTCTPLVTIRVSDLTPGNQVTGSTIEELGPGNRPLDMVAYRKNGHDYVLIANSARGVIRLTLDHPQTFEDLTSRPQSKVMPRLRLSEWKRVHQLKKVDDATALILTDADGSIDLRTVALP